MRIEIPDDLVREYEQHQDKLREVILLGLRQLKLNEALLLYRRGLVSFERAAELAGLSIAEMARQARAGGFEPRWSDEMLQDELS
jgi:predicted HTH domain antitoxin